MKLAYRRDRLNDEKTSCEHRITAIEYAFALTPDSLLKRFRTKIISIIFLFLKEYITENNYSIIVGVP